MGVRKSLAPVEKHILIGSRRKGKGKTVEARTSFFHFIHKRVPVVKVPRHSYLFPRRGGIAKVEDSGGLPDRERAGYVRNGYPRLVEPRRPRDRLGIKGVLSPEAVDNHPVIQISYSFRQNLDMKEDARIPV
jgi:hypothetical protein